MSTLDFVLQRQMPVRSVARMGGESNRADAGGGPAEEAFSSVLSGKSRNPAAERQSVSRNGDPDPAPGLAADAADGTDQPEAGGQEQPDDMLSLLESLMTGTALSETLQPGALGEDAAGPKVPASDGGSAIDVTADDLVSAGADDPATEGLAATAATATATGPGLKAEAHAMARPAADQLGAGLNPEARGNAQSAAVVAAGVGRPGGASAAAGAMPVAALVAAGPNAATARPGPANPQAATAGSDQQKVSGENRETVRTLGMAGEPSPRSESKNAGSDDRSAGSGRRSAMAARAAEEPLSARAGAVEVIDSRRFMPAQAVSGNAQMLTRSLIDASDAALATQRTAPSQAAAAAQPQTGQMLHTLKLQLNPISLGSVIAVLKLTGEELSVKIQVETAEAYRQLSDDNQSILKAMRAQGYAVEQITVQHVASGDRSGNAAQQQGFQGSFQGSGSADTQTSDRGTDGRSTGQQGANQNGGQGREQNPYPGSGAGRSDGVYL